MKINSKHKIWSRKENELANKAPANFTCDNVLFHFKLNFHQRGENEMKTRRVNN